MKRDWDFIRDLLIDIESEADIISKYDNNDLQRKFREHLWLLTESEVVTGIGVTAYPNGDLVITGSAKPRLTMQGHDLLSTLKSPVIWEKIKAKASEMGVSLGVESIKALASLLWKGMSQ